MSLCAHLLNGHQSFPFYWLLLLLAAIKSCWNFHVSLPYARDAKSFSPCQFLLMRRTNYRSSLAPVPSSSMHWYRSRVSLHSYKSPRLYASGLISYLHSTGDQRICPGKLLTPCCAAQLYATCGCNSFDRRQTPSTALLLPG